MTGTRLMKLYRNILVDKGMIHLKTDSNFMYTYTVAMIKANGLPILQQTEDLYHSGITDPILSIQTFYEKQWLERGLNIKYIQFLCEDKEQYLEPEVEIEPDAYRSFNRSRRSGIKQTT